MIFSLTSWDSFQLRGEQSQHKANRRHCDFYPLHSIQFVVRATPRILVAYSSHERQAKAGAREMGAKLWAIGRDARETKCWLR